MSGVILDTGAFLALERHSPKAADLFNKARKAGHPLVTSAGVVGQVWRGESRQAPVAMVLKWENLEVTALTEADARTIGRMLAVSGTVDVIDAHIALLARNRDWPVVTSDPDDMRRLDRKLELWKV